MAVSTRIHKTFSRERHENASGPHMAGPTWCDYHSLVVQVVSHAAVSLHFLTEAVELRT